MESAIKNMEFFVRHWGSYRRTHPAAFRLLMLDSVPGKTHWIRHTFNTCNLSLILRGQGRFVLRGRTWDVVAPCVITQPPGEHVEYGPFGPGQTWDELFMMYDAGLYREFGRLGLIDESLPVWPILNPSLIESRLRELRSVCAEPAAERAVDRVDRLCELLLLESRLPRVAGSGPAADGGWAASVEQELAADLELDLDLDDLAVRHGMSPATFRRRWAQAMSVPPARYRSQARLRAACRLLAETTLPIRRIAAMVGFHDELYFSRRFAQEMGLAPREYRRTFLQTASRRE